MHVGNGEANYSIIDNEVQKDTVIQDMPVIHASGIKGALKEFFEQPEIWGKGSKNILTVFGGAEDYETTEIAPNNKEKKKKTRTVEGRYKFFNALCLARPLRVTDGEKPYILATSNAILEHFSFLLKGLGCLDAYSKLIGSLDDDTDEIEVEGEPVTLKVCNACAPIIGKKFAVFDSLSDYALPVRARNVLGDGGQSKNLWYEELVPHKSVFFFAVLVPNDGDPYASFKEHIQSSTVQFGGNASIGNGYTRISEMSLCEQAKN
jgi:CRISPR-associated protein Cmr4